MTRSDWKSILDQLSGATKIFTPGLRINLTLYNQYFIFFGAFKNL